jgi:hypothetical protein
MHELSLMSKASFVLFLGGISTEVAFDQSDDASHAIKFVANALVGIAMILASIFPGSLDAMKCSDEGNPCLGSILWTSFLLYVVVQWLVFGVSNSLLLGHFLLCHFCTYSLVVFAHWIGVSSQDNRPEDGCISLPGGRRRSMEELHEDDFVESPSNGVKSSAISLT